jgi:hypothetical protein
MRAGAGDEVTAQGPKGRAVLAWGVTLGVPAAVAIALYVPALSEGFISDDFTLLLAFHGAGTRELAAKVAAMFVTGVGPPSNQYRPLSMLSFALSDVVSGTDAAGWRLVNIVLHGANAALVALLVALLLRDSTTRARATAIAAGLLFAVFPPSVEAVAWIAARFDGMVLFFSLVSACAFVCSRRWFDACSLLSLAAAVAAFLCKEAAAILPVLVLALAWWKQPAGQGPARELAGAVLGAAPWLALAVAYFMLRLWIFGDPFRVFPGTSPMRTLFSGEWLSNLRSLVLWWPRAMPEPAPRIAFGGASILLVLLAIVAALRERALGRVLLVSGFAGAGAACMLLLQLAWPANGEAGRVLYEFWAIAVIGLALPLAATPPRWVAVAWFAVGVALVAQTMLARAAIERRVEAGRDMQALLGSIAAIADTVPPNGYAFVVLPDYVGSIPFGRDSQSGLMLPPLQARSLAPRLVVQTTIELGRWPDLFQRDIIGRLQREPLADVAANPLTAMVPPPHLRPDRYFCFNPGSHTLVPLALHFAPDLSDWTQQWRRALVEAGCGDSESVATRRNAAGARNS